MATKKKPTPKAARRVQATEITKILNRFEKPLDVSNSTAELFAVPERHIRGGAKTGGVLDAFMSAKTPQQRVLEACRDRYVTLTESDPELGKLVATMITLRRAYAVAYRELHGKLTPATPVPADTVDPNVLADFVVQYAMYTASLPFSEHDVMNGLMSVALPWLADTVDKHLAEDEAEEKATVADAEQERRSKPIPINMRHSPTNNPVENTLDRATSLVLVGWGNAVSWLLDNICKNVVAEEHYHMLRLARRVPRAGDLHSRLLTLGGTTWAGCTDTERSMGRMVQEFVMDKVGAKLDLVICDDLGYANTTGFIGRLEAAKAGDAHKRFRSWCKQLGAGFVGAVPLPGKGVPDVSGPEFEQLRAFTLLRQVTVTEEGENYKLVVGNHAAVYDVPKTEVDAYGSFALIV